MRAIKAFTVLAVLAAVAWGGYWFAGSRAIDRALTEALARNPQVSFAGHRILGFPNRFDVTLDQPRLAFEGGEWSAPFVQVFALTYRLNHVIAVFANQQSLRIGDQSLDLTSTDLRASVIVAPELDLPLERTSLVGEGVELRSGTDVHRLGTLRLASRRRAALVHEVVLMAENILPDPGLMDVLDPARTLPRQLTELRLDAEIETDRPLDRHAQGGVRVAGLAFTGARLAWVDSTLALSGRLSPEVDGRLTGELVLSVQGWAALQARARSAGMLDPAQTGPLGALVAAVPVASDSVEIPLAVRQGDVWLGPILLLTLPPLR